MANEILDVLKKRFPKVIAHTVLGYHVKIDEAQSRGLAISEYAPRDRGALAMAALAEELESRVPANAALDGEGDAGAPRTGRQAEEPAERESS